MAKALKESGEKSEKASRNMMIREGMFIFKQEIRYGLKFILRIV